VVGKQPERPVGGVVLPIAPAAHLLPELDQRPELVGLEDRGLALEDRGQAVEPEAGVDVLRRQRRQRVHRVLIELHEHEVPVLEETLVVAAREIVRLAELEAAIEVQLRARPARTGWAGLPEVLRSRALDDPLARDADLEPRLDGVVIRTQPELIIAAEHGDPDFLRRESVALGRQFPGEPCRLALEVVTEREVAQHLEEREMARSRSDDVDVNRAERLLTGGDTLPRRLLDPLEIRLERMHPGDREKRRRIVLGRDQRGRRQAQVTAILEELEVRLANLVGGHRSEGHRSRGV
jgi:hypothetical protein